MDNLIQQFINEKMKKMINPEPIQTKPVEEILPTTNYAEQVGKRPLVTAAPMDLEFKANASPASALGMGIGKALQHLYNIKALNEQQAIKDYEGKLKMAQEKDLNRAAAQEKIKFEQAKDELPSAQAQRELSSVESAFKLAKMQEDQEMMPLEKKFKQAQIARAYRSNATEARAENISIQRQNQLKNFYKIAADPKYKEYNKPEYKGQDKYILIAKDIAANNPEFFAENPYVAQIYSGLTQGEKVEQAGAFEGARTTGGFQAIKKMGATQNQQPNVPAQPQSSLLSPEDREALKGLFKGGK